MIGLGIIYRYNMCRQTNTSAFLCQKYVCPVKSSFLSTSSSSIFVLCRLTKKYVASVQQRCLSGADAVNALRPFYFAVHPDFFAQYPKERVGV